MTHLVTKVENLPEIIREAFVIAESARPGPVVIDIPKDMTFKEIDYKYPEEVRLPGYKPNISSISTKILDPRILITNSLLMA